MKAGIHPDYVQTTITCACGEVIHTRSTKLNVRIEICSKCHPFFTGKQRFLDTAGRIEKFEKKFKDQSAAPKPKKAPKRVEVPRVLKMPKSQPILSPEERRAAEKAAGKKAKDAASGAKAAEQPAEKKTEKPAQQKAQKPAEQATA